MIDIVSSALILAWVAILVLALAMAGLLRQVRALSSGRPVGNRLGPAPGSVAPPIPVAQQSRHDGVTVLLFLDAACEVCTEALRTADELAGTATGPLRFVAIFASDADVSPQRVEVVEHGNESFARYGVPAVPFAVAVGGDRRIVRSGAVGSPALVRDFVAGATADSNRYTQPAASSVGAMDGADSSRG